MPQPTKIPRPFADSGDKNSIPDSSDNIGFASWQEGFPVITSEPFASGGVAPKRADFNGVFNALSAATVWNQQGGVYAYDNATDYEVGNVVEYNNDLYKCITANGPSTAVKAPTDKTVWDAIATASGYLPLSGGTLTGPLYINGKNVAVVESVDSTNSGYVRFTNGLQVVWGKAEVPSDGTGETSVTFEKPFSSVPQILGGIAFAQFYINSVICVQTRERSTTGFVMCINRYNGSFGVSSGGVSWVAIGAWA